MAGIQITPTNNTSRNQLLATSSGMIAYTANPNALQTSAIPTTGTSNGTVQLGLVGLRAGDVITNCACIITALSVSLQFAKFGLYTSTGTFIAATASFHTSLASGAARYVVQPLTAAQTITTDGGYYVAFLQWGSGATGASLATSAPSLGGFGTQYNGTGARPSAQVASTADLSGNLTLADTTLAFWFGVS